MKKVHPEISTLINHYRGSGPMVLLESQMPGHSANDQSFLAAKPSAWIKCRGNEVEIMEAGKITSFKKNPWQALSEFKETHRDWLFGYLGYDLKNYTEELVSENKDVIQSPDLFFMIPEVLVSWNEENEVEWLKGERPELSGNIKSESGQAFKINLSKRIPEQEYISEIERAKADIYEGEYYEINLSHPIEFNFEGEGWALYQAMKAEGPVPFGAYLEMDELTICSSSPERYLAKSGSRVWSQPIKGTASRNREMDESVTISRLQESEKEKAENLMIVDLVRNDLGRIAKNKSVRVSKLFEIQSFETVHQMVSTVECEVSEYSDTVEIIKACFPMGSMTGAPKIATMKAIEKYETYKRGVYSGAIGYIKPNGDFDFNVVIRTALIQGNKLVYPVGGAITSDSDPAAEWKETLIKARAITNISIDLENPE